MRTKTFLLLSLFVVLSCVGCGNGNVSLGGKVTFSDDGAPLEVGTIAFTNGTTQARGEIGPGGKFDLGSLKVNDGLPAGSYKVYISGAEKREETAAAADAPTVYTVTRLIDPKYENPESSGITYAIDVNTKSIEIQVDRATGEAAKPQKR